MVRRRCSRAGRLERTIVVPVPVPVPPAPRSKVSLGAPVALLDAEDECHAVIVVGEKGIDVERGRLGWCSPLGRAVTGREVGDAACWEGPVSDLDLEVVAIGYPG